MRVRVLHTPGHTHTHLSFALEADGEPVAVFTGGSLLFGSTGRPDLLGPDHTDTLAHAQWHSAQPAGRRAARRDRRLPDARLRQLLLGHPVRRPPPAPSARRSSPTRR